MRGLNEPRPGARLAPAVLAGARGGQGGSGGAREGRFFFEYIELEADQELALMIAVA